MRTHWTRWSAAMALVIAAVTGVGCGDSNDGGGPASTPTPRATATPIATVTATPLDIAALAGAYDAAVEPESEEPAPIAFVAETSERTFRIHVDLHALNAIDVAVTRAADGSLTLDGDFIDGDASIHGSGVVTVALLDGGVHIAGSLDGAFGTHRFTIVRPPGGTPVSLAGSYAFLFTPSPSFCGCALDAPCECPSLARLALTVDTDGTGTLGPGMDLTHSDVPGENTAALLGSFGALRCDVSPTGRLRCVGSYDREQVDDPNVPPFVTLQGRLPTSTEPGRGELVLGGPPALFGHGTWTVH